jgi:hypothetical protein
MKMSQSSADGDEAQRAVQYLWERISEKEIALPLESVEEVKWFAEKVATDDKLRKNLVRILFWVLNAFLVELIMLWNLILIKFHVSKNFPAD